MILLLVTAFLAAAQAWSQSPSDARYLSTYAGGATSGTLDPLYIRPPPSKTLRNYTFDAFGPYAIAETVLIAGLDQATNTPPEWRQGFVGYSERFGSDFGIAAGWNNHALWARRGLQGRYLVLSLQMHRFHSPAPPCGDLHIHGASRRRRPSRLLYPVACRAVCGRSGLRSTVGIRLATTAKDALRMGNYSLLESCRREYCLGVSLQRTPRLVFTHSFE